MDTTIKCKVMFVWDSNAAVWVATSKDVPGLVLESGSFDELVTRVRYAVPELLSLNSNAPREIDYTFVSKRTDRVPVYG